MEINSENLKKLIVLKFGSLQKCAEFLNITPGTLTRNLSKPSKKFIDKLKNAGVPMPDDQDRILLNSVSAVISKDGLEGFIVKETNGKYSKDIHHKCREELLKALQEIKELKAENYDLKKQLEGYKK